MAHLLAQVSIGFIYCYNNAELTPYVETCNKEFANWLLEYFALSQTSIRPQQSKRNLIKSPSEEYCVFGIQLSF